MWHARERKDICPKFWWGSPKEREHNEERGVGDRKGSEWIWGRLWELWSGFSWLRIGQLEGYCKHGDEASGSGATELALLIIKLVGHIYIPLGFKRLINKLFRMTTSKNISFSLQTPKNCSGTNTVHRSRVNPCGCKCPEYSVGEYKAYRWTEGLLLVKDERT
jgi:hypothetical protein